MIEVVPAIIPESFDDLRAGLALVRGLVRTVQVDIFDGTLSQSFTWPYTGEGRTEYEEIASQREGMPFWRDFEFEIDLSVKKPELVLDDWINTGASSIIIHLESTDEIKTIAKKLQGRNVGLGLAILPSTPNEELEGYLEEAEFVQFMGNDKIGFHGVELDEAVYPKIEALRNEHPEVKISVDIGVDEETAPRLVEAGVNKLVSGSAIFGAEDIETEIRRFQSLDESR